MVARPSKAIRPPVLIALPKRGMAAVHPSQPFASVVLKGSFGSEKPIPQWKANGRLGSRTRGVQVIHAQAPANPTTQHGN